MIRRIKPSSSFTLGKHRIYMLPTRYGLVFVGLVFVILLASINYGNGMGYGLSFLLTSVAFISMLYTHRNLIRVQIQAGHCTPVFAGEAALFHFDVSTRDGRQRVGIELQQDKLKLDQFSLPENEIKALSVSRATNKRGYIDAPRFRLLTRFPFGLVYTWSRDIILQQRCLVYPKPAKHFSQALVSSQDGHAGSTTRTNSDEFSGLREYQAGDSRHHIHWRASARSNSLVTKLYGGDDNTVVWFDWHRLQGDTESRLSQLCRGILDAQADNRHYGLKLPNTEIAAATGQAHQHKCLEALACYGA
ncbi:MAG: DUF58 domain-containing protein [Proteobacteria bacterium]|nr:DUF58 domain-containing protein [Pseudomonadota bacterium]